MCEHVWQWTCDVVSWAGVVPLCSAVVGDGGGFQVAVGRSTHLTSVRVIRKIKKIYMRGDSRCVLISI